MVSTLDIHIHVSDGLTLALSIVTILIVICLILRKLVSGPHSTDDGFKDRVLRQIRNRNNPASLIKAILEDYSTTNEEVARRDQLTLFTGSILITASFALLGGAAITKDALAPMMALASLGLYLVWLLFFYETAQKLNWLSFQRARAIEGALTKHFGYNFGIHSYFTEKTSKGTTLWLRIRRTFWYSVLLLLALSWLFLSLSISFG